MILTKETAERYKAEGYTRDQVLEYIAAVDRATPVHGWEDYCPQIEDYYSLDLDVRARVEKDLQYGIDDQTKHGYDIGAHMMYRNEKVIEEVYGPVTEEEKAAKKAKELTEINAQYEGYNDYGDFEEDDHDYE